MYIFGVNVDVLLKAFLMFQMGSSACRKQQYVWPGQLLQSVAIE